MFVRAGGAFGTAPTVRRDRRGRGPEDAGGARGRAGARGLLGETASERDGGVAEAVVRRQLGALEGLGDAYARIAVAYEPVWAIGTGRAATAETAQDMHAVIRARLGEIAGEAAGGMRILYGGSVKGDNARSMTEGADVDGVLVGGASLRANSFLAIVSEISPT